MGRQGVKVSRERKKRQGGGEGHSGPPERVLYNYHIVLGQEGGTV